MRGVLFTFIVKYGRVKRVRSFVVVTTPFARGSGGSLALTSSCIFISGLTGHSMNPYFSVQLADLIGCC